MLFEAAALRERETGCLKSMLAIKAELYFPSLLGPSSSRPEGCIAVIGENQNDEEQK